RAFRSPARALRAEAVKKLVGLSSALLTLLPVASLSCVLDIRSAVFWSDSRLARTAFERVMSDMDLFLIQATLELPPLINKMFTKVNVNEALTAFANLPERSVTGVLMLFFLH